MDELTKKNLMEEYLKSDFMAIEKVPMIEVRFYKEIDKIKESKILYKINFQLDGYLEFLEMIQEWSKDKFKK
jgi:hypothetical protein